MKKSKKMFSVIGLLAILLLTVACGKKEKTKEVSENNNTDAKTIVVGTGSSYEPYCYLDEDGTLIGYEIAVLHAVDDLLPQYLFDIQIFEFKNIAVGIDAGKLILVHINTRKMMKDERNIFSLKRLIRPMTIT